MRNIRTAVLAGVAALCVAGTAVAASNDSHVMTVDLPDGSVARIEYQGDVAPRLRIDPSSSLVPVRFADPFDVSPFAALNRIFADMDRQAAAMMQHAEALRAGPVGRAASLDTAGLRNLPGGTVSYRFVSMRNGNKVCARSWQVTTQSTGELPKLISASSGDCGDAGNRAPAMSPVVGSLPETRAASSTI